VLGVSRDDVVQPDQILGVETLQFNHLLVDLRRVEAQHVCNAAGHACRHVAADLAEHHDAPASHVFTRVVANALHDGESAGVARTEPLADPTPQEHLARRRTEHQRVARDHVVLWQEQHVVIRPHDDPSTRKSLADIVVRVADQLEGDAGRQEGAK